MHLCGIFLNTAFPWPVEAVCPVMYEFKVVHNSGFFFYFDTVRDAVNLTTISTELGYLWEFVRLSLKTCSFYHEKLFIQVVNDIRTQVFNNFFSASDIMEAVRGRLCFYRYECNARLRDTS